MTAVNDQVLLVPLAVKGGPFRQAPKFCGYSIQSPLCNLLSGKPEKVIIDCKLRKKDGIMFCDVDICITPFFKAPVTLCFGFSGDCYHFLLVGMG